MRVKIKPDEVFRIGTGFYEKYTEILLEDELYVDYLLAIEVLDERGVRAFVDFIDRIELPEFEILNMPYHALRNKGIDYKNLNMV